MKAKTTVILGRLLLAAITGLGLLLLSCSDSGTTEVLFVDINHPMANDLNVGTQEEPLSSIQEAADRAGPGTIICIMEGTYDEMVTVTTSGNSGAMIVFKPYGDDHVVINSPSYACFNLQEVEYVEITGFELTGAWAEDTLVAHGGGIRAYPLSEEGFGANNCIFSNNVIYDNDAGIWIVLSHYNIIKNNIIYNSGEAPIRIKRGVGNQIFNNLCYNNGSNEDWGICYYGSPFTKVYHNTTVEQDGGAVYVYEGTSNLNGAQPGTPEFCVPCSDCEVYDNIGVVYGDGAPLVIGSSTTTDRDPILEELYGPLNNQYHHNLWFHESNNNAIVSWGDLSVGHHVLLSLEEFQQKHEDYGLNSIAADPLFINSDNNNFRLSDNSPAKGAASDGTDMGVDFDNLPNQ